MTGPGDLAFFWLFDLEQVRVFLFRALEVEARTPGSRYGVSAWWASRLFMCRAPKVVESARDCLRLRGGAEPPPTIFPRHILRFPLLVLLAVLLFFDLLLLLALRRFLALMEEQFFDLFLASLSPSIECCGGLTMTCSTRAPPAAPPSMTWPTPVGIALTRRPMCSDLFGKLMERHLVLM